MVGNIVGEPFKKYVNDQIKIRQKVYGSGFDGSLREQQHLNYLNSRLSWVKMASSVLINPPRNGSKANIQQAINTTTTGEEGLDRLSKIGIENPEAFLGYKLASSAVLFNGLQQANFTDKTNPDGTVDPTIADKFNKWQTRMGYAKDNSIWNNSAYGLGGTEFGLQPMPGITGVEINHINRGSIKKATITLKAYNKFQFELIDLLYLRLGFNMLIEWGNSHYIESDGSNENGNIIKPQDEIQIGDITTVGATLTEQFWFKSSNPTPLDISKKFEEYRIKYDGNCDGLVGRVSNFNWNFNPDGSYDITIQLTSLGDVVESFKVNTLPNPDSALLKEDEANISQILLNLIQKQKNIPPFNSGEDINYVSLYENSAFWTSVGSFFGIGSSKTQIKIDKEQSFFIRLGELLRYIKDDVLPVFSNGNKSFPIIDINDNTRQNVMPIFPNQISLDPRICIINTSYFSPPPNGTGNLTMFSDKLNKFNSDEGGVDHGKLMNIYLNFSFIKKILINNLDSKGNLSLYNFIQAICEGINRSLGGINNLEPIVNEETNTLTIIDQTQFEGKDKLRELFVGEDIDSNLNAEQSKGEEQTSTPFQIYGYDLKSQSSTVTSNFVKSYSFTTEIGPNLSTTIAIGATANGNVVGEDATAFSQWNKGLTDRFKQSLNPNRITTKSQNIAEANYIKNQEQKRQQQKQQEEQKQKEAAENIEFNTAPNYQAEANAAAPARLVEEYRDYYLPYILGNKLRTIETKAQYNTIQYLEFDEKTINRGYTSFKNYFSTFSAENNNYTTGTIGFLPINLQIEIDGLSGIKVYQKILVDTSFLPSNYPSSLEFLVKQVNHSIKDNKWVTSLETLSVPKIQKIPFVSEFNSVLTFQEFTPPEDLILFSPINVKDIKPQIRTELTSNTVGNFGVNRDSEVGIHRGIDLFPRDEVIRAPIDGIVEITKPKDPSKLKGVKITGTGEFTNYIALILYIDPSKFVQKGQTIKKGERIGIPQDLSVEYDENITDHIHFELQYIKDNGQKYYIDPTNLKYTILREEGSRLLDEVLNRPSN